MIELLGVSDNPITKIMPYRCQKCMNTFKTLTLYNKHATGPSGSCNVDKIQVAKPVVASAVPKTSITISKPSYVVSKPSSVAHKPSSTVIVAKPSIGSVGAKPSVANTGLKRLIEIDHGSRSERKKIRNYKETDVDEKDIADQIIADALGEDSDHDPDYNPKGDKEDDEDVDLPVNRNKTRTFTQIVGGSNLYSKVILPRDTFNCTKCSKKFDSKNKLNEHFEDVHERSCAECEDDFAWPDPSHECYFTKYKLRMVAGDIMPSY